jgi:hypothetical protein
MNTVKLSLEKIFGKALPEKTTNFHTSNGVAVFVVTDLKSTPITSYVELPLTSEQTEALKKRGLFGSFGWALQ